MNLDKSKILEITLIKRTLAYVIAIFVWLMLAIVWVSCQVPSDYKYPLPPAVVPANGIVLGKVEAVVLERGYKLLYLDATRMMVLTGQADRKQTRLYIAKQAIRMTCSKVPAQMYATKVNATTYRIKLRTGLYAYADIDDRRFLTTVWLALK